jgi:hypothetical protein
MGSAPYGRHTGVSPDKPRGDAGVPIGSWLAVRS